MITATAPAAPPVDQRRILLVFAGLLLAMFLSSLDQTVFSTALPTIVGELNGVDHMLWVTTAYILASTIMMPVYGKLGDLIGRKSLFISALSLFVVGSVFGGLAASMTTLIIGRSIQGLGGGGLMILAQAIIADVVPARQRGRYAGVMGGVFGISAVVGPLLGGYLTEGPGWRWAFWINVPLGLLAIAAAARFLRLPTRTRRVHLDVAGITVMAVAVTGIVLVSSWGGNTYAWNSPLILGLIVLVVVAGTAFVLVERRAVEPIIPMHLFADRNFVLATTAGLAVAVAMFGAIGYLPTYLQMVKGYSATAAGLLLLPMIGGLLLTSIGGGQIVSRTGRYKVMTIASGAVVAVALALLSMLTPDSSLWSISSYVVLHGFGIGLRMQILVLVVQNSFPASEVGTATAANNFFRQIGASLGSAAVGSLFTARLASLLADRLPPGAAGVDVNRLTPDLVRGLPESVRTIIAGSYNDALMPVLLYLAPLGLLNVALLIFLREKPLATTLAADEPAPAPAPTTPPAPALVP